MPRLADCSILPIYTSTSYKSLALGLRTSDGVEVMTALPLGWEGRKDASGDQTNLWKTAVAHTSQAIDRAISLITQRYADRDLCDQSGFDLALSSVTESISDSITRSKTRYLLSASWAKACAHEHGMRVHEYLAAATHAPTPSIPVPLVTLISGGVVATSDFRVQAIMIVPTGIPTPGEGIRCASEVSQHLGQIYRRRKKPYAIGDEGGYSTSYSGSDSKSILFSALTDVCDAVSNAGYELGAQVELAIDFAAEHTRDTDATGYRPITSCEQLSAAQLVDLVLAAAMTYPIRFVEDPLSSIDTDALSRLRQALGGRASIVADDLSKNRSPGSGQWDATVVMPDRIGTVTQLSEYVRALVANGQSPLASHRSSETEDVFLSDLAVGLSLPYLKAGGMNRTDRTAKYNQLLRIVDWDAAPRQEPAAPRQSPRTSDRFIVASLCAREILDSRGRPTVEAEVCLRGGAIGRAAVPSGASTGTQEALELRDCDPKRYLGGGMLRAVHSVAEINTVITGRDARDQRANDGLMIALDNSQDNRKSRLGANAILAVSLALAHASARQTNKPLYKYLRESLFDGELGDDYLLPTPMLNFINGGAHADNGLDFQEFMLVPHGARSFSEAMEWASKVFLFLLAHVRRQETSFGVGDEGGFSIATPPHYSPRDSVLFVLDLLRECVEGSGYTFGLDGHFAVALDPAASEFYGGSGKYLLGRKTGNEESWDSHELVSFYEHLVDTYPVISIEDGMAEHDISGWQELTKRLKNRCQLVGDDLFVTNPSIFKSLIAKGIADAILVKVNQIGTLTEALDVIRIAKSSGYRAIVSHRSGETEDTTISDIAVATNAGQIKSGCLSRTDRVAKYNRLLRISSELPRGGCFEGGMALNRSRTRRKTA